MGGGCNPPHFKAVGAPLLPLPLFFFFLPIFGLSFISFPLGHAKCVVLPDSERNNCGGHVLYGQWLFDGPTTPGASEEEGPSQHSSGVRGPSYEVSIQIGQ